MSVIAERHIHVDIDLDLDSIYFGARLRFGAVLPGHVGWGEKVREVVAVSVVVESSLQDIAWKRRASRNQF